MKKFMTIMLGLSLALGATSAVFGQDKTDKTEKKAKKMKKAKKTDATTKM